MESPFAHVLQTNYAPTEQELGMISHLLVGPENELQYLNGAIRNLESHLRQMSERRAVVRATIKAHRALTRWIRRVPDEILQEIFLKTLPYSYFPTMSPRASPVVLTHVCRRWRRLAHSNPRLWAGLHVKKGENLADVLTWLSRAGSVPISLSFSSVYDIGGIVESLPDHAQTKWNGFQMSLERFGTENTAWFLFDTYEESPLFPGRFDVITNNPIQHSRRLHLDISQNPPTHVWQTANPVEDHRKRIAKILDAFSLQRNSHLQYLTLRHNQTSTALDITQYIPCTNLKYLELGTVLYTIPSAIAILQQCPRLVSFKLDLGDLEGPFSSTQVDSSIAPSGSGAIHRSVEQLSFSATLSVEALRSISATFNRDNFPSMNFMHLEFMDITSRGLDETDLPKVLAALDTSLTSLTISPQCLEQDEMIRFLSGLPSLVQLHLLEISGRVHIDTLYDAEIIQFLSPPDSEDTEGDPHGCQQLQYLKLGRNSTTFTDDALPGLLFDREVPLRQAHIHFYWQEGEMESGVEYEDFDELIEAGLDLQLRYGEPYHSRSPPQKPRVFPQVDRFVYGWEDF